MNIKEFKPAILFLVKFLVLYLVLNVLYGLFIDHYVPHPDPVTEITTVHSAYLLNTLGYSTFTAPDTNHPAVFLNYKNSTILSVYEGCNGLNVAIIFIVFLLSYGRLIRKLWWFIPLGLVLIYLANLGRIILLFFVTIDLPGFLYFAHKYLFTAIIYAAVFALWYWWVVSLYPVDHEVE